MINLTKKQTLENRKSEIKKQLLEVIEKNDFTVFTNTLHTSKSGLTRSIETTLKDGTNITDLVAELCDYKYHKTGGLKVIGTGMDMGFHVVYGLSVKLYCDNGYNHDSAYKLTHKWL